MDSISNPLQLKRIYLKNRLVRSAVHSFLGNKDSTMSEAEYAMYEELARNGVGMIITGHASVSPVGMANEEQAGIYDDRFIAQFTKLKEIVSPYGVKVIVQINHAGERAINTEELIGVVARELKKGRHCRAFTRQEIREIGVQFIEASHRLWRSGVDGVQIHAAHSYLLSRFLDETFNQRTDEYGGSIENRFRLLREIIEGIKEKCGDAFPVLIKINNDSATHDEAYAHDLLYVLQECKRLDVEVVEFSGYDFLSQPKDARAYYLARVSRLRQKVDIPMALVGGIRSAKDADSVLTAGIDLVSLGRPLIAEPDYAQKIMAYKAAKCISCNRCFAIPKIKPGIRCILNRKK